MESHVLPRGSVSSAGDSAREGARERERVRERSRVLFLMRVISYERGKGVEGLGFTEQYSPRSVAEGDPLEQPVQF